jgi:formate hydrogenlyase subunit 3/multisubunit Na+/H+ antiporter MnhD subunit
MFDKSTFLQKVFPPLRIQKPGYDIYARTTFVLLIILVYIFIYYGSFTVPDIASVDLSSWSSGKSEILKANMAFLLIFMLVVICIERYSSRTDTKVIIENREKYVPGKE